MPPILEVLVVLSHDDYRLISSVAESALSVFSDLYSREEDNKFELTAVMEERLHSLASSLPRLLRSQNDTGKVSTLQLLAGYLQLLQWGVAQLVRSHAHLSRIIQALVMVRGQDFREITRLKSKSSAVSNIKTNGVVLFTTSKESQGFRIVPLFGDFPGLI